MINNDQAGEILSEMVEIARTFRIAGQHNRQRSLTGTRFGVLQYLRDCDARLSDVADRLSISASVASRAVDSLELDGLVHRGTDSRDARATSISITGKGRSELSGHESAVVGRFADALEDWSDADAGRAIEMLHRLNRNLGDVTEVRSDYDSETSI